MTRRWVAIAAVVLLGVLGCGLSDDGDEGKSNTPRRTTAPPKSRDRAVLLTDQDLHAVAGFEGVVAKEIENLPLFENPDPRGPCGGKVPPVPLDQAFGRSFQSERLLALELVVPAGQKQKEQLAAYQADLRPGCGPYESKTNTGDSQRVSEITPLALDGLAIPAIGWFQEIEVQGQRFQAGVVLAEVGARFLFLQFQGTVLPPASSLEDVSRRAVDRLR